MTQTEKQLMINTMRFNKLTRAFNTAQQIVESYQWSAEHEGRPLLHDADYFEALKDLEEVEALIDALDDVFDDFDFDIDLNAV